MTRSDRHFACTQCGACCNRAPELELGEAAALADVFVLRLMLRIYSLPRSLADYASDLPRAEASAEYYESKRFLGLFAAASWNAKVRRDDHAIDYVQYLSLSVLPLDLGLGVCAALSGNSCAIYASRPLSCRTVPLHYSRPEAAAVRDLDAFVTAHGFRCASCSDAPLVIDGGAIVDPAMRAARTAALVQADRDAQWKAALVKAMKAGIHGLPSPRLVEANAVTGALTASMLGAWQVAEAARLTDAGTTRHLLAVQSALIERELGRVGVSPQAMISLRELRREYAAALAL